MGDGWIADPIQSLSVIKDYAEQYREEARLNGRKPFVVLMRDCVIGKNWETCVAKSAPTMATHRWYYHYGAYVQEMLQAIEDQWTQLAQGSREFLRRDRLPPKITLRFTLDADGRIRGLQRLDAHGDSVPAEICRQAIVSRVPFGKWSAKMIEDFGGSDEVTINFLYR